MSHFSIAGLQLELTAGDNRRQIKKEILKTKAIFPWVDMIILPELASFGTNPELAENHPSETEQFYSELAKELAIWLVPGSMFQREGEDVFNVAPVINPEGEVIARYRKIYPFYPYEKGVSSGDKFVVFDVPNVGRFGVSICYDQWYPEVTRNLTYLGAEVIICPTLTGTIDREVELAISRTNATIGQCYFLNVNAAGELGVGQSILCGPDGAVLHQASIGRELMPIELDLEHVRRVRERGMFGLGQTIKSFRDNPIVFDCYQPNADKQKAWSSLGELEVPKQLKR
ncbi:carbon-nitrogen hydrolase family protein [uncultured Umboniibacter sp.]|uniref:carbon-nitrogen hydrolase family protein n=1 Tax=uncultured Umboniibacter sp. TaxID=1798917 RepID=UPI00260D347C|nr:carbon-nitrogen hydrolase family protein [uncultured Umboniibacter sp.]